jgi:glutaredoxin
MSGSLCRRILGRGSSEMPPPAKRIVVYGASWCPDARRARRFFDEHGVDYAWTDIDEDSEASDFVRKTNGGQVVIPVIVFPDHSVLVEPTNYELAKKIEAALLGESDPEN